MPVSYKYYAFISYSHKDKKWADWLHRSLEGYRVPKKLVGKETPAGPVPKRLFPIFRDREELPVSADLSANIHEALKQSKFLIVICSPNAAKSKWVNEEILAYNRLGGEGRILCLIVDGEPNAGDKPELQALECFPEALQYRMGSDGKLSSERTEPIAADLRKGMDGKGNSKLKIVAGLMGVGFDELKQRDRVQKMKLLVALSCVLIILTISFAYLAYDAYKSRLIAEKQNNAALKALSKMTYEIPDRLKNIPGTIPALVEIMQDNVSQMDSIISIGSNEDSIASYKIENYKNMGVSYFNLLQNAKGIECYLKAESLAVKLYAKNPSEKNAGRLVLAYMYASSCYINYDNYNEAIKRNDNAYAVMQAYSKSKEFYMKNIRMIQNHYWIYYKRTGDMIKACAYAESVLVVDKWLVKENTGFDWKLRLVNSYGIMGDMYQKMGVNITSKEYYNYAIDYCRNELIDKAEMQQTEEQRFDANAAIAACCYKNKLYDNSLNYYNICLDIARKSSEDTSFISMLKNIALCYNGIYRNKYLIGDYEGAKKAQLSAMKTYMAITAKDIDNYFKADAFNGLSWHSIIQGDSKQAIQYASKAIELDSLGISQKINMAHALLLGGNVRKAIGLYRCNNSYWFKESILNDFEKLNELGIKINNEALVRKALN